MKRDSERHISLRSPSGEVEGWVHVEQVAAQAHALYSVWERERHRERAQERERENDGALWEAVMVASRESRINRDLEEEKREMAGEVGW